jgi:hypothetical protein
VGLWQRRPESGELAARTGRGGGARGFRSVGTRFEVRGGEGLTKFGLSVAARFGRRGMPVRESSGGCGGRLEVRVGAWRQWEAHRCQGGPE